MDEVTQIEFRWCHRLDLSREAAREPLTCSQEGSPSRSSVVIRSAARINRLNGRQHAIETAAALPISGFAITKTQGPGRKFSRAWLRSSVLNQPKKD